MHLYINIAKLQLCSAMCTVNINIKIKLQVIATAYIIKLFT